MPYFWRHAYIRGNWTMPTDHNADQADELPLDGNFVEQAEYISEEEFKALSAMHPDEERIIKRLTQSGAKLLIGPRGCGKTTLMLKAYYELLRDKEARGLPIYVNFKLSLKLEPIYIKNPNAAFWFRAWLNLKIYEGLHNSVEQSGRLKLPEGLPTLYEVRNLIADIEAGTSVGVDRWSSRTTDELAANILHVLQANSLNRCVLLLDDAAHAFSTRQQEDFFEFFRQIKTREISPKAAIYPGITTHTPTFQVGHDAEQINVWVNPTAPEYVGFMRDLAVKRFGGQLPDVFHGTPNALEFLAFAAFGIPRSFLNMLRTIYHDQASGITHGNAIDRRKLLVLAKQGRELSHAVYESLSYKIPAYRAFVSTGQSVYQSLLSILKDFNKEKPDNNQALQVGIKRPVSPELEKVFTFLQYAGLLMPAGENSRGVKGVFELYLVHFGDLVTENAIIGRRTKSMASFVSAFTAQTHQAWPRVSPESLVETAKFAESFRLSLPNCQVCGTERASEHARFCQNCGAQLKELSVYDELVNQDISVLPISKRMIARIRDQSNIRKIKDILIDSDRSNLRSIQQIGPVRASRIASLAEEHVA